MDSKPKRVLSRAKSGGKGFGFFTIRFSKKLNLLFGCGCSTRIESYRLAKNSFECNDLLPFFE